MGEEAVSKSPLSAFDRAQTAHNAEIFVERDQKNYRACLRIYALSRSLGIIPGSATEKASDGWLTQVRHFVIIAPAMEHEEYKEL